MADGAHLSRGMGPLGPNLPAPTATASVGVLHSDRAHLVRHHRHDRNAIFSLKMAEWPSNGAHSAAWTGTKAEASEGALEATG